MTSTSESATACAMASLARREHSGAELRRKLERRGFSADTIEDTIQELESGGWLSEQRLVDAVIRKCLRHGRGPLRLRAELHERGVDPAIFEPALEALDVDWDALAAAQLRKRFGDAPAEDRRELARRGRFLQGLGFPPAAIWRCLDRAGRDQAIDTEWDEA